MYTCAYSQTKQTANNQTNCVDIDEKIFKLPGFTGTLRFHPDSDVDTDDEDLHPSCQSKRFIPCIRVTAAVTRPEWDRNGNLVRSEKVGVYRCWDEATRKQGRYEYTIDPTTNKKLRVGTRYEKGDTSMKDKNVDAEFHHKLMTTKSMPDIRAHYGTRKLKFDVAFQHDGAGGHGAKGSWSYKIEQDAEKGKAQIFFHTQPANSSILAFGP
jgi:hypothetical protein